MPKQARILVAEEKIMLPIVMAALEGYQLFEVTKLQEAQRMLLEDGIDLVSVGIHFDDSRAMELIKLVRLDRKHQRTPIVVHRLGPSDHTELVRLSVGAMVNLNVVSDYLELEGDPDAGNKIRAAVEKYLLKENLPVASRKKREKRV